MLGALTFQGWRGGAREEKGSSREGRTITASGILPAKADAAGWGRQALG